MAVNGRNLRCSYHNSGWSVFWSAPAERSGDGALDPLPTENQIVKSAVAAALCRRTPKPFKASLE
ncbi:MAG: hypothetical protein AUJ04_03960 [Acidobacteria bacterium 13_1_40CM_3_55_6]|nr:MAG: hypothetical protein AUJ04_03960 [Acidobacteria bacterium 13_1_40CM_3_55_6]